MLLSLRQSKQSFSQWYQWISGAVGCLVILLALSTYLLNISLVDVLDKVEQLFSWTFVLIFSCLVSVGIYSGYKISQHTSASKAVYWLEVGQHSANGVSTLALTFTLLGISVGIGTLSENTLSPDTINSVIQGLTSQFSMAFMTTVVGLPAAALIRAWVGLKHAKLISGDN